jgi:hypothetical protein
MRGVERIWKGRYRHLATGRYIIETEFEGEGPRGGTRRFWEFADDDRYGGVVLDGLPGFRTLREAIAELDRRLDADP